MSWKTRALPLAAQLCRYSGLNFMCRPVYGGLGTILMFHRFTDAPEQRVDTNGVVGDAFFDCLLAGIKKKGPEIIALRDVPKAIREKRRFVSITIDDGYRDNALIALPVLRRYDAPVSIFVPSAVLDRTIDAWWLQIEEKARRQDNPRLYYETQLRGIAQDPARLAEIRGFFTAQQEDMNDRYFMNAAEVRKLDQDPLVDIGGHTITHRKLKDLDESEAEREIVQNKKDLEALLERPVDIFAYPFGDVRACGRREFLLAGKAGYKVAVTTREGNVFSRHEDHMMALPRYSVRERICGSAAYEMQRSGTYRALKSRFGCSFVTE